jgi:hypothetical protein
MKIQPVTDEEIAAAFRGTNFGAADHRRLLALSVMKKALRFHCGHTITEIMVDLQLTTRKRGTVTDRGRHFAYQELGGGQSG